MKYQCLMRFGRHCFKKKTRQQKEGENNTIIDGYYGFIFTNRFGGVYSAHFVNRAISRIIADYNQAEVGLEQIENRSPALLPHFSVHHLRHTFCSRMCENTSDSNTLKVIQEIMGHADISTTLDVYTDLTRKKKDAFAGLQGNCSMWYLHLHFLCDKLLTSSFMMMPPCYLLVVQR